MSSKDGEAPAKKQRTEEPTSQAEAAAATSTTATEAAQVSAAAMATMAGAATAQMMPAQYTGQMMVPGMQGYPNGIAPIPGMVAQPGIPGQAFPGYPGGMVPGQQMPAGMMQGMVPGAMAATTQSAAGAPASGSAAASASASSASTAAAGGEEEEEVDEDGNKVNNPRRWSQEEDDKLRDAVKEFGEVNWKAIAERVASRNHVQCLQRWKKVLKPGLVKGQWSAQEDAMLVTLVSEGFKNWGQLAAHMPGRTSKQCRERWCHHLDPSIKKGDYTPEEDKIIIEMQSKSGNKWAQIAQMLPGRTENAVKIRWKALDRSRKNPKGNGQAQIRSRNTPDSRLRSLAARAAALAMSKAQLQSGNTTPAGFPQDPVLITKLVQMQQAQIAQSHLASQYIQNIAQAQSTANAMAMVYAQQGEEGKEGSTPADPAAAAAALAAATGAQGASGGEGKEGEGPTPLQQAQQLAQLAQLQQMQQQQQQQQQGGQQGQQMLNNLQGVPQEVLAQYLQSQVSPEMQLQLAHVQQQLAIAHAEANGQRTGEYQGGDQAAQAAAAAAAAGQAGMMQQAGMDPQQMMQGMAQQQQLQQMMEAQQQQQAAQAALQNQDPAVQQQLQQQAAAALAGAAGSSTAETSTAVAAGTGNNNAYV